MVNFESSYQDKQFATKLVTLDQIHSDYRAKCVKYIVIDVVPTVYTNECHYINEFNQEKKS